MTYVAVYVREAVWGHARRRAHTLAPPVRVYIWRARRPHNMVMVLPGNEHRCHFVRTCTPRTSLVLACPPTCAALGVLVRTSSRGPLARFCRRRVPVCDAVSVPRRR
jgi:hypothetical protein